MTSACGDAGLVVTSSGERTHIQPWSHAVVYEVCRADGTDGRVWFKANGIGTRHEPELISALSSLEPNLVPEVLTINVDRDAGPEPQAWSLTRDAGPTWRSTIAVDDQWPLWEDLLQRYAVTQLRLAAHLTPLLAAGTPERSPATLPRQAADLIAELTLLDVDSGGLSVVDSRALSARLPAYDQWCRDLDGSGIPWTIQHDDLHANNICRPEVAGDGATEGDRDAGPAAGSRIIDWGDASIGYPLATMLCTLGSIAFHGGCEADDPRVQRVRDAYLEPFTTFAPRSELIRLVDVARRVGAVSRALSWRAALIGSRPQVHRDFDFPVRGWLQELLAD